MENTFYFTVKTRFVLKMYVFVLTFCYVEKRLDEKPKVIFKNYDVINWETNNYNTHITQYLKK